VRSVATAAAVALAALSVSACKEIESATVEGYEPAHVKEIAGRDDVKSVTFTAEGARRTGLRTAEVKRRGGDAVVPYAALIYDAEGKAWVYTSPRPLTFLREQVRVDRVEDGRVFLNAGPRRGTQVVTVGAAEVHGAELEIGSSH
jgi:hypothetical protein